MMKRKTSAIFFCNWSICRIFDVNFRSNTQAQTSQLDLVSNVREDSYLSIMIKTVMGIIWNTFKNDSQTVTNRFLWKIVSKLKNQFMSASNQLWLAWLRTFWHLSEIFQFLKYMINQVSLSAYLFHPDAFKMNLIWVHFKAWKYRWKIFFNWQRILKYFMRIKCCLYL